MDKKQRKAKQKLKLDTLEDFKDSMLQQNGHCRCLVIDEPSASWGYRILSSALIPEGSIPINDKGELTHYLCFDGREIRALNYVPTDNDDKTPEDCFEAGYWEELEVVLSLANPWFEKIKLGVFVALAIGLLIVLFMISAVALGR